MRIGIISTTKGFDWAATDEVWSRFAAVALASGHQVAVSATIPIVMSNHLCELRKRGLQVFCRRPFRPTRLYLLKERYFSELREFEAFRPDVILFNGGSIFDALYNPALELFCHRFRGPIVFLCHGHSPEYDIGNRATLRKFLSRLAWIVFVSQENLQILQTQLATTFDRTSVIWNSSSFELSAPLPWPRSDVVQMACVARLDSSWKGQDVILGVLSESVWRERSWHLSLCGVGKDVDHLRELIAHFRLWDRVTLRGHVDDIIGLWKNSHLMLLASRAESLSLAVLEAMMCGRPSVVTDVGDLRHVVKEGVTGFVAEAAASFSFGKALERAWLARTQWEAIGNNAHAKALELRLSSPENRLLEIVRQASALRSISAAQAPPSSVQKCSVTAGR